MKQSLQAKVRDSKKQAIESAKEVLKDEKFKTYLASYEKYESEALAYLKSVRPSDLSSLALEHAVILAELRILGEMGVNARKITEGRRVENEAESSMPDMSSNG